MLPWLPLLLGSPQTCKSWSWLDAQVTPLDSARHGTTICPAASQPVRGIRYSRSLVLDLSRGMFFDWTSTQLTVVPLQQTRSTVRLSPLSSLQDQQGVRSRSCVAAAGPRNHSHSFYLDMTKNSYLISHLIATLHTKIWKGHDVLQIRKFKVEKKSDLLKVTLGGGGELYLSSSKVPLFPPCTSSLLPLHPPFPRSLCSANSPGPGPGPSLEWGSVFQTKEGEPGYGRQPYLEIDVVFMWRSLWHSTILLIFDTKPHCKS